MNDHNLKFIAVEKNNSDHINLLYDLLKSREYSISHKSLPKFETHESFVKNHPYREWFLILHGDEFIGSVYVTNDNIIGIPNLKNELQNLKPVVNHILKNYAPLPPIPSIRAKNFLINIPKGNTNLQTAVETMGAEMIQTTYRL